MVEAKATDHAAAQDEVQYYMINNKIHKDIIGISVSGQSRENILVTYYLKLMGMTDIKSFPQETRCFLSLQLKNSMSRQSMAKALQLKPL